VDLKSDFLWEIWKLDGKIIQWSSVPATYPASKH
jgi:hypothetical protein